LNNLKLAESNIRQAEERLKHAGEALTSGNYPYTVRQCQEAVELLLKAALRIAGIEPPKWHDVGPIIRRELDRFPQRFRDEVDFIVSASRRLRNERERSMYGDEETGLPPEELYTRLDAEQALSDALKIRRLVLELLGEASGGRNESS